MEKKQKSVLTIGLLVLLVLLALLLTFVIVKNVTPFFDNDEMEVTAEKNPSVCRLNVMRSKIEGGVQFDARDIKGYRNMLKVKDPSIDDTELNDNVLTSAGYTSDEIEQMSEETKAAILDSKNITIQKIAASETDGLNLTVTYYVKTITIGPNFNLPVNYYMINVLWNWKEPGTLVGSPDYICVNVEKNKGFYSVLGLASDPELLKQEFCRFTYTEEILDGTSTTWKYGIDGQCGEVKLSSGDHTGEEVNNTSCKMFALNMPKNEFRRDLLSGEITHKTTYKDFKGEAQFVLNINATEEEGVSQNIGVTYGHSYIEYVATFSESQSVNLGVSVNVEGPSIEMGYGSSSGWSFMAKDAIESKSLLYVLSYKNIQINDGKVYNIVNLSKQRALEYTCGLTTTGTTLKLADESYLDAEDDYKLSVSKWQWKVDFNPVTSDIVIHPLADPQKFIEFNTIDEVSIGEYPTLSPMAIQGQLRIAPFVYTIPQHNITIANCYKIMGGYNYSELMDFRDDFYKTVTHGAIGTVFETTSSWIFYEVPEDKVAEASPLETDFSDNGVYRMRNVGTGRYLDVCNGSIDYGAELLVYEKGDGYNQQFKLKRASYGVYFIEPYHTLGFNLDVPDGSLASGVKIKTYGYNGFTAQQFRFYPIKNDGKKIQYIITTVVTNNTKSIQGNANYSVTQENVDTSKDGQLWELEFVSKDVFDLNTTDSYFIRNKASKYYFDVSSADTKNNTELLQYDFTGGYNQQFKFTPNWEGSFYMIPQHATNKVVELKGESVNGYRLKLYSKRDDKPYQRFKFLRASADSFYILTGASGYSKAVSVYGDVHGYKPLEQWDRTDSVEQQWVLEICNRESRMFERYLTPVSITGTTVKTLSFTPLQTLTFNIETVGVLNTTVKVYEYRSGTYVLLASSSSGGLNANAKVSLKMAQKTLYKIEVSGASGQNGTAGVIVYI